MAVIIQGGRLIDPYQGQTAAATQVASQALSGLQQQRQMQMNAIQEIAQDLYTRLGPAADQVAPDIMRQWRALRGVRNAPNDLDTMTGQQRANWLEIERERALMREAMTPQREPKYDKRPPELPVDPTALDVIDSPLAQPSEPSIDVNAPIRLQQNQGRGNTEVPLRD